MNHDELEWQAQEQARLNERHGRAAGADPVDRNGYRIVARALRTAPMDALPPDFARRLAARVEAGTEVALDTRLEQAMTQVLAASLALGAVASIWRYGADWMQASAPLFAAFSPLLGWGAVVAGCVALSWLGGRLGPGSGLRR